jgi:hypothetical protein
MEATILRVIASGGVHLRVIYLHAIKKVAGYAHAIEKFPDTCVPCP